jgi:hypothetical protein
MTPEPIISNPIPPAAIQIVSAQRGAYENYVFLGDGRRMSLVKYVQEYLMSDVSGDVMDYWVLENWYGTSVAQTPAAEGWMSAAGAGFYRGLFVPSLSDLGIDANKYKVEVCPAVVMRDNLATGDFVEIRLLNVPSNTVVAGAEGASELSGTDVEQLIQGEWVEVPTNSQYFVDVRKINTNSSSAAQTRRQLLYLRLVRR